MKKLFTLLAMATLMIVATITSCSDDDKTVNPNTLPETATKFIETYFPGDIIKRVEKNPKHPQAMYDVTMKSGFEFEFDGTGQWVDIDAPNGQIVPEAIIPYNIATYLSENYSGQGVTEISKETYGYSVDLTNGLDLTFDTNGQFMGVDK